MEDKRPEPVETQRAYDMIHRDAIAHIASMKDRTWKITNYAPLLFVALYFLTGTPFAQTCWGKTILTFAAFGVAVVWGMVIFAAMKSMQEKRERLDRLYNRFEKDAKAAYGDKKPDRTNFWYDKRITIPLGLVVIFGALVVIAKTWF